jgi:hypothetical protein
MLLIIFFGLLPAHGPRRSVSSVAPQDRVWIGFQYSSMIGRAPWPPSRDKSQSRASRAKMTRSRISPYLSCRPCCQPFLSESRIATGARTDFGEERELDWLLWIGRTRPVRWFRSGRTSRAAERSWRAAPSRAGRYGAQASPRPEKASQPGEKVAPQDAMPKPRESEGRFTESPREHDGAFG